MIIGNYIGIGRKGGGGAVPPDGMPSDLVAEAASSTAINLNWTIGSTNQTGHRIYISTDDITYVEKGTVLGATASYQATGLTKDTLYYFRVVAYLGANESDYIADNEATAVIPTDIANMGLWIYPDDIAGNDGDEITTITSKEGNAYGFVAAATKRPTLKKSTNGLNGHNTLRYDGTNDISILPSAPLTATEGVVWIVATMNYTIKNAQDLLASADEASASRLINFQAYVSSASPYACLYQRNNDTAQSNICDTFIQDLNAYRFKWKSTGSALTVVVNGRDQVISGTNNGDWFGDTSARDNITIGGTKISGGEYNFFKGDIAEILVYERALSVAEDAKIEKYINTRYGKLGMLGYGDSITHGYYATWHKNTWLNQVCLAKGYFPAICSGRNSTPLQNSVQNKVAVIGGAFTNNGRDNYVNRITQHNPEWVLILYGIVDVMFDDVGFSVANYENDLGEVVDAVIAAGVSASKIVIGSPPYMNNYAQAEPYDGGSLEKHGDYIAAAAAVATAKGTKYIDVYQYMADNGAGALLTGDGLHPSEAGHVVIAAAFLSVM